MRNQAYASLVRPILEHACCVWNPHQCKHIKQLKSGQRHAARFTTGNYYSMNPGCVTNMVTQLCLDLLEHRRAKHRITMFYENTNNLANIHVRHQLKVHDSSTCGSASHKFRQLNTKLNCYKYSFLPTTIGSWKTLRLNFVSCRHWNSFNMHYRKSLYHHLCNDDMGFLNIILS